MKNNLIKYVTAFAFIANCFLVQSQLTTSTVSTPTQLVEDVLVGNGVSVSNISYIGSSNAIGSFNGANTNVGLNSGIILTTGTVLDDNGILGQKGPFGPNDNASSGVDNDEPGYAPLTAIAADDTENAAVLEFDFVPQSDTIRFKYVFGSDEYPNFVGSEYNDVFAFFISGPGFGGTQNMALIPGTTLPITINNVNAGMNAAFFVNNGDGNSAPQNGSNFYIQYNGFTTVIEAVAKVQCGETYHLKIAIADVSDGKYDSGIFLEANSLSSYAPLEVSTQTTFDLPNHMIAEGCEVATVTLNRDPQAASDALTIPILVTGTATEGVDYGNIPNDVTFAPGQVTLTFTFDVFNDALTEGNETIIIKFNHPDPCGNDNFITEDLIIFDVQPLVVNVADVNVHCPGDDAVLVPTITGGINQYTYLWGNGETTESITVSPSTTTSFSIDVTDACLPNSASGSGSVIVPNYPPVSIVVTADITVLCPNTPGVIAAEASGGEGVFTYKWNADGIELGANPTINVSPMETTNYTVTVIDGCGSVTTEDVLYTVTTPVLKIVMTPEQLICPGDSAFVSVVASSGLGNYTYYWHHTAETTSEVIVKPDRTTEYTVSVEDGCHTYHIDGISKVKVVRPHASFSVLTHEAMVGLPTYFQNHSTGSVAWQWDFNNHDNSNSNAPHTTFDTWGWHEVELIAYNEIGCTDTINRTIYIKPEYYFYAPNAFTPDADAFNSTYSVSVIGAKAFDFMIFNRWGDLIYQTSDIYFEWDGSFKGYNSPDGAYVYRVKVTDKEGYIHHHFGTINLLR